MEYTYKSTQQTECDGCGNLKHTPLRRDEMGGYVCLTCIDKQLDNHEELRDEMTALIIFMRSDDNQLGAITNLALDGFLKLHPSLDSENADGLGRRPLDNDSK